jgi:hypothetical protein
VYRHGKEGLAVAGLVDADTVLRQPYAGFWVQLELAVPNVLCEAEYVPSDALRLTKGDYLRLQGSVATS